MKLRRTRRDVLRALGLLSVAAVPTFAAGLKSRSDSLARPSGWDEQRMTRENRRPGGADWQRVVAADAAQRANGPERWEAPNVSGYADRASVEPGGTIRFHVSTRAPRFDLTISRMGWYGGRGGRTMETVNGLPGLDQPIPAPDPATGLVAANWEPSYTLHVPTDWPSGVYVARLLSQSPLETGYIVFVVRDDDQPADFVYKVALNTYQAYNNWGGKSLYDFNSVGGAAVKVSFDRPYDEWYGSGRFFYWDYPMIRWLEREGYNVTYITDVDAHADRAYLPGRRALLSVGHDEYWSKEMRDSWEEARDGGHSLAFLSGNVVYWQVRYEPAPSGPNRVLVCYRDAARDPLTGIDNTRVTALWHSAVVNRPPNALAGVQTADEGSVLEYGSGAPYVVKAADHWIFEGTGARSGQVWSTVAGYEVDSVHDNGFSPPGLVVLSESPVVDREGKPGVSHSTYYRRGGMVFAAGTIQWSWGLDDWWKPGLVDPRIQRTTANILEAFRQGAPPSGWS